jgi:hypothetical protein
MLAFASPVAASSGFRLASHLSRPPVVCATGLPHRIGLYCASPAITKWAYDGRGVVRLGPAGRGALVRSGSDLLLAIDGSATHTRRPLLGSGHTWSASGYRCHNDHGSLSCRRDAHGFTLARRVRTF